MGSMHDLTIAKLKLVHELETKEQVTADKGYIGHPAFLTPYKGPWDTLTEEQKIWNKLHTKTHWANVEYLALLKSELALLYHSPIIPIPISPCLFPTSIELMSVRLFLYRPYHTW
ncbi:hypothetical protein QOT17_001317 [Balamuthia mandrillaris]